MSEAQAQDERVASIHIAAPIQRVWDEITKTSSTQRSFFNTVLVGDLTAGSRLRYYSPNRKRVFVVGEVIEATPPIRFVHTYIMTMDPDPETTVTWDLVEVDGGCQVTITHTGWTDAHRTADKTAAGWEQILDLLKGEIETGELPVKTRLQYRVIGLFQFALPKRTSVAYADEQGW